MRSRSPNPNFFYMNLSTEPRAYRKEVRIHQKYPILPNFLGCFLYLLDYSINLPILRQRIRDDSWSQDQYLNRAFPLKSLSSTKPQKRLS